MAELSTWAKNLMVVLTTMYGAVGLDSGALGQTETMSTMFSCMLSAEVSMDFLVSAAHLSGIPMQLKPILAIDINPKTAEFSNLRYGHRAHEHLCMSDIMLLFDIPFWNEDWSWQAKLDFLLHHVSLRDYWVGDNGEVHNIPYTELDVSGSPCVDFSAMNRFTREGRNGPHNKLFVAYVSYHIRRGTKVLIHENVAGFDVEYACMLLGPFFTCFVLYVEAEHAGYGGVARTRCIIIAYRHASCRVVRDVLLTYQTVTEQLRKPEATAADLFTATADEIRLEEEEQCRVRRLVPRYCGDLQYALHPTLQKYIRGFDFMYWSEYNDLPSVVEYLLYNLQDNPNGRKTWSAVSRRMPSLRRDSRFVWSPFHRRWLSFYERMAALGFPIYPEAAVAAGVAQFLPPDRDVSTQQMIGDTIHVANIGIVIGIALACVEFL